MKAWLPFDLDRWQPVQEALSEVLGLPLNLITADGQPMTRLDTTRAPWAALATLTKGYARYADCVQALLAEARRQPHGLVSVQTGGLHLYAVPVEHDQQLAAYFILGPCLVGRRGEPDDYMALAKEFDVRIDQWMDAMQEIKVFSHSGINAIAALLQQFGALMCARQQEEEPSRPRPARVKVYERLLDLALHAVHAERGCILVQSSAPDELVIQAARGLSDDVVRTTRVRIGEGVAGIVAADHTPLRLNAETTPPRLARWLRYPELRDAMVVPMMRGGQLLGVLCVSTAMPGGRLREDGLTLLQQVSGIAEAAL